MDLETFETTSESGSFDALLDCPTEPSNGVYNGLEVALDLGSSQEKMWPYVKCRSSVVSIAAFRRLPVASARQQWRERKCSTICQQPFCQQSTWNESFFILEDINDFIEPFAR